jgi:ribosomal protein S18 acetylase RimI-like enzyme
MKIRPYSPNDWVLLCAIHDAARLHELQAAGLSDAFLTLEKTAENEGLFDAEVFVAEIDGQVHGFAACAEGELTWLYVEPKSFRRGIGRQLVRYAIHLSGGNLSTEVLMGNESALNLYLSEGFKIIRRCDGKLVGNESFAASGYVLQRIAKEA